MSEYLPTPAVLFRSDRYSEEELQICEKYFSVVKSRMKVPKNSLVIGRYSVLPFYNELISDLLEVDSKLINTATEHYHISSFDWYNTLINIDYPEGITPRTWFDVTEASKIFETLPNGMILKGRTNSAKVWDLMYAKTKEDFYRIDKHLHQHEMIGPQGIVYREYIPLEIIEKSVIPNSHNFVNEWRCFFYKKSLLCFGYYWSVATDEAIKRANEQNLAEMLFTAQRAADALSEKTTFFVVDVAKTVDGRWIVIEVNDGQMSGLSMCNPDLLYVNLAIALQNPGVRT